MSTHIDILEQRESLKRPLVGSAILHLTIFGAFLFLTWYEQRGRVMWGDPHSMGGAVGITPISQIPLPSKGGLVNPVANDTESAVPTPPAKPQPERRTAPEPKPDAIAIKGKSKTAPRESARRQTYRSETADRQNQLYSTEGQALSSPMFGGQSGSGGVGIGSGSPFGNRYGYYLELLRQRIAEKWRTNDVNPRLSSAPPVIVVFDIYRDGGVRNVRLLQGSGDSTLDYSAQRAVYEASPLPPLPPGFDRNSATIEFWFQLKR
jgi:periplasmic protein TonB